MIKTSRRHLRDTGESYGQHLRFATKVGALAVRGGLACFAHALIPGLFQSTGSRAIRELNRLLEERRPIDALRPE